MDIIDRYINLFLTNRLAGEAGEANVKVNTWKKQREILFRMVFTAGLIQAVCVTECVQA